MTIEMGESLIYSWMKHVLGCLLVQTNWKASCSWTLSHQNEIFELVTKAVARKILPNKRRSNVETLTKRVLKQFECDCVGMRIHDGFALEFVIADVAFHGAGLHYTPNMSSSCKKSDKYTARKVVQKLFVSAISLRGYLGAEKAKIVFATPRITPAVKKAVKKSFDRFVSFWHESASGVEYEFELITDEKFRDQILKPMADKIEDVADTSELYMRCIQLESIFEDIDIDGTADDKDCDSDDELFERSHKNNLERALKILGKSLWAGGKVFESIANLYDACALLRDRGKDSGGWLRMALREEYRRKKNLADRPTMRSMKRDLKK